MSDAVDRGQRDGKERPLETGEPVDLDTRELFAGRSEIRIAHDNSVYRLRITRAGKLILNK
jgi:hemin uptake protein HemP